MVSNADFLSALFGPYASHAHVTAFPDPPDQIPADRHMKCWAGGAAASYPVPPDTNQYFTISIFSSDEEGRARRRKALFRFTPVIVLDDVKEKLSEAQAKLLPPPTYKLETSPGSEQWGYVLVEPEASRPRVENLLDGLVANGLAPDGKDPGMKGVTRYVRLPEGINNKASKFAGRAPWQCKMLEWAPWNKVTMEQLAAPFNVNLDAERREARVDGAADVADHPLLQLDDIINIKEVRSDGRFDITCPWVSEHTDGIDNGSAVFTNADGSIGFKCHHGACQERTGKHLLDLIEQAHPGFRQQLNRWQTLRLLGTVSAPAALDFLHPVPSPVPQAVTPPAPLDFLGTPPPAIESVTLDQILATPAGDPRAIPLVTAFLRQVDGMDHASRIMMWQHVRTHMGWNRADFERILEEYRREWYPRQDHDFYDQILYVSELNQFYDTKIRKFMAPEGFQNTYAHLDEEARANALLEGRCEKVDRLDYAPGMPSIFTERGARHGNTWIGGLDEGAPGDVSMWLAHFDAMGLTEHREHVCKWMAFTLRYPERKINHALIFGSKEGGGKDWILYPLVQAMAQEGTIISGTELLRDFDDYLLNTKFLLINEVELADASEARTVGNRLKPLAAAPPNFHRVNLKGIKPMSIRNICNVAITTNSSQPLRLDDGSRRYYAMWTYLNMRDEHGQVLPEWQRYWAERWHWMRDQGGWRAVVHYLMTSVDLSDFDPGAAPAVTDFLREIQEASENPIVTSLRGLIINSVGVCASDLVSNADLLVALRGDYINDPDQTDRKKKDLDRLNVNQIGRHMKAAGLGRGLRSVHDRSTVRLYSLRNHERYAGLGPTDLYRVYQQQRALALGKPVVEAVK